MHLARWQKPRKCCVLVVQVFGVPRKTTVRKGAGFRPKRKGKKRRRGAGYNSAVNGQRNWQKGLKISVYIL